jgi:uncharacterized membrane protein
VLVQKFSVGPTFIAGKRNRPGAALTRARPIIVNLLEAQAALRRAFDLRAGGRRTADLRRALPDRFIAAFLGFALRAGLALVFALLAIVILSLLMVSAQTNTNRYLPGRKNVCMRY